MAAVEISSFCGRVLITVFYVLLKMRELQCVIVKVLCFRFLLSQEANTSLMRSCWNELFILGLAQCAHVMNLSTILTAIISHLQSSFQDGTAIWVFQKCLYR